jgi:hypothetical protein
MVSIAEHSGVILSIGHTCMSPKTGWSLVSASSKTRLGLGSKTLSIFSKGLLVIVMFCEGADEVLDV